MTHRGLRRPDGSQTAKTLEQIFAETRATPEYAVALEAAERKLDEDAKREPEGHQHHESS